MLFFSYSNNEYLGQKIDPYWMSNQFRDRFVKANRKRVRLERLVELKNVIGDSKKKQAMFILYFDYHYSTIYGQNDKRWSELKSLLSLGNYIKTRNSLLGLYERAGNNIEFKYVVNTMLFKYLANFDLDFNQVFLKETFTTFLNASILPTIEIEDINRVEIGINGRENYIKTRVFDTFQAIIFDKKKGIDKKVLSNSLIDFHEIDLLLSDFENQKILFEIASKKKALRKNLKQSITRDLFENIDILNIRDAPGFQSDLAISLEFNLFKDSEFREKMKYALQRNYLLRGSWGSDLLEDLEPSHVKKLRSAYDKYLELSREIELNLFSVLSFSETQEYRPSWHFSKELSQFFSDFDPINNSHHGYLAQRFFFSLLIKEDRDEIPENWFDEEKDEVIEEELQERGLLSGKDYEVIGIKREVSRRFEKRLKIYRSLYDYLPSITNYHNIEEVIDGSVLQDGLSHKWNEVTLERIEREVLGEKSSIYQKNGLGYFLFPELREHVLFYLIKRLCAELSHLLEKPILNQKEIERIFVVFEKVSFEITKEDRMVYSDPQIDILMEFRSFLEGPWVRNLGDHHKKFYKIYNRIWSHTKSYFEKYQELYNSETALRVVADQFWGPTSPERGIWSTEYLEMTMEDVLFAENIYKKNISKVLKDRVFLGYLNKAIDHLNDLREIELSAENSRQIEFRVLFIRKALSFFMNKKQQDHVVQVIYRNIDKWMSREGFLEGILVFHPEFFEKISDRESYIKNVEGFNIEIFSKYLKFLEYLDDKADLSKIRRHFLRSFFKNFDEKSNGVSVVFSEVNKILKNDCSSFLEGD